jgi:dihydroorotate dehydrogenase
VYPHASYVAINISSPNTKNLRQLQGSDELDALLMQLKAEQERLADLHGKYVPLALKIAPDLDSEQISRIAILLQRHRMDGVIATNTTLTRTGVEHLVQHTETGGLSGAPLCDRSTAVIRELAAALQGALPIIGVGGILSGQDAAEKISAGAALIQIYSGLIYRGPGLINECAQAIGNMQRG